MDKKHAQILVALSEASLDRLKLMKVLFMIWFEQGLEGSAPFIFQPYLYGPYSLDVYKALDELKDKRLILQGNGSTNSKSPYFLTKEGKSAIDCTSLILEREELTKLKEIARSFSKMSFKSLLTEIYTKAPEYAINPVVKSKFLK